MNENRFAALRALLDCLMNESRSAELMQSLGSVSGPLPAILENILRRDDLPSLPENARLLLSMIPELYRMCASEQMGPHPQLNTLQKAGEYAPQLRAYAAAVERILSLPVRECVLYFLRTDSAVNVPICAK